MGYKHATQRYRHWYANLLRLYPKPYYERFGEGMEQTFTDLLQERAKEERGLFGYALWVTVETLTGIIKENITFISMQKNKRLIGIVLGIALLLLIPLLGNWPWTLSDFVIMGIPLLGTGLVSELIMRRVTDVKHRAVIVVVIVGMFLLTWAELAVGVFGTPFAGN